MTLRRMDGQTIFASVRCSDCDKRSGVAGARKTRMGWQAATALMGLGLFMGLASHNVAAGFGLVAVLVITMPYRVLGTELVDDN
jgi:hypothetical protein